MAGWIKDLILTPMGESWQGSRSCSSQVRYLWHIEYLAPRLNKQSKVGKDWKCNWKAHFWAAGSIVGNFWPPSPIGAISVRAFGPVLLISPGNSAHRWEYFWSPKKYLWPGVLALWNTLIEKNTVVPVHGDCLDNQSIDQAKQKEVNQTHGHGLISSDLSFNSDPVTHCHCYSCCRKISSHKLWLTIGSAIYVAYQWSRVTINCFEKWISDVTRSRLFLRWVTKTTIIISNPKQTQICSFMAPIAFLEFTDIFKRSLIWNGPVLWLSPCRQVVKYFAASFARIGWLCLSKIFMASEPTWKESTISFINLTCFLPATSCTTTTKLWW